MKPIYLVIPAAVLVVLIGVVVSLRWTVRPLQTSVASGPVATRVMLTFEAVRDLLHKAADYEDCRTAVQQLNLYIDGSAEEKPRPLSKEEMELLKNKDLFGLDESELAEVNRTTFTALDAHHLELCLLLNEAMRGLRTEKLAALQRAAAGFDWVLRQVQLRERPGDALPPGFVLRRGYGTALERAQIFLAVLQQLGIDGCMLAVPGKPGEPALRYWLPGAFIDGEIYLFDTRLGLPLPGPKGAGIATLAQVRQDPETLRQLTVESKVPYDVSQDQVRRAEIHAACTLPALAPRMRYLQEKLSGTEACQLGADPVALMQRFRAAAQNEAMKGVAVRVWNLPGDLGSPIRVLRNFVPEEEGGVDKNGHRDQWKQQLIPTKGFPRVFADLVDEPRRRLQLIYAYPFIPFFTQAKLKRDFIRLWLPGLERQQDPNNQGVPKESELLQRDRMPRDLLLRGRYAEATNELVIIKDELKRQMNVAATIPELEDQISKWCTRANAVFYALQGSQRQLSGPAAAADPEAASKAQKAVQELWRDGIFAVAYVQAASAEQMSAEVTYLLALCKHEEAERRQARQGNAKDGRDAEAVKQSWESAISWWTTFLENHPSHSAAASARLLLARARLASGKQNDAVATLEDLSGRVDSLDRVACLYLIKQWKTR